MKLYAPFVTAALLSACAAQKDTVSRDTEQAVRDLIEVHQLKETPKIRTANGDGWTRIDPKFIIYNTRDGAYLLEFQRRCDELDSRHVVPDERWSPNAMHAGFETLRGCHIAKLYPLTEEEAAELAAIGESPGSRN